MEIRNIAIIAHVDHGKTTLVDHLLQQNGVFESHREVTDRHMDSMDLEKEKGITISAKNASFQYKGVKVNVIDTPGHGDFGGEVERILDMVDGAILLVDCSEGPLPQTRFVLQKALDKKLKILVCVNKIDRKDARTEEVLDEIFSLLIDLGAPEDMIDLKPLYAIGKDGKASKSVEGVEAATDLSELLDEVLEQVPPPKVEKDKDFTMMISQLDYDDFVGRLAWGRIRSGTVSVGDKLQLMSEEQTSPFKVSSLFEFQGSNRVATKTLSAGDIAVLSGFESDIIIGDTIAGTEVQEALPALRVDEPTVGVFLSINTSPFAGLEGDYVTSRKLKERLEKELLHNVAVKVEETDSPEIWKVLGRGELQLALLAETMRREGYEFMMSQPQVVIKKTDAGMVEPYLTVQVDVDETHMGIVTEKLGKRKAQLRAVEAKGSGRVQAVFFMPSRGLIGYRSQFLTDTRGTGLLNTQFDSFQPHAGPIHQRNNGPLVSDRQGVATPYSLFNLEDRGRMFIRSGTKVYKGMIIGEYNRSGELNVNITKEKKLTNMRASGSDENVKLSPVQDWTIEKALEWISDEEKIEITPKNIRLCKKQL